MPSYLSSTQTGGVIRESASASSATGDASMQVRGWNSVSSAASSWSSRAMTRRPADVPGEHPGPLDVGEVAVERARDARLQVALPEADAQLAREHLDHGTGGVRVAALAAGPVRASPLAAAPRAAAMAANASATSVQRGRFADRHVAGGLEHVADGLTQVRRAVVGRAQAQRRGAGPRGGLGREPCA